MASVVMVDTREQALVLTELHQTHGRLARLLTGIAVDAERSRSFANLDTLFLTGQTNRLPELVSRYDTLREVAYWVGASRELINRVCTDSLVTLDYPHEEES